MGSSISSVRVLTSSREQIKNGTVLDTIIEALWDNAAKDLAGGTP